MDPHVSGPSSQRLWSGVLEETASLKKPDLGPGMRNENARHTSTLLRPSKRAGRFVLGAGGKLQLNSGGLLQLKQVRSLFPSLNLVMARVPPFYLLVFLAEYIWGALLACSTVELVCA